ncbi:ribonuclease HII [Gorillibacterium sp. sgz500922]|uniref:ribonuclease HII n=1 Tax=Gorillibacterium sp. sgz500922 TaxID=3446694 RepID=UPI003F67EDFC
MKQQTDLLEFENQLWAQDVQHIAGIDEVGRGCLFGDVVAAAVILPAGLTLEGVDDSKKLSAARREELYERILEHAVSYGIAAVPSETVDKINIKQAARLAMKQALQQLQPQPDYLLVDAEKVDSPLPQLAIIHGDARSQSIAAASILAKVTRDRMCLEWDRRFPEYGIAIHKGYATREHRERLKALGPTPLHRTTFLKKLFAEMEAEQQEFQLDL